MGEHEELSSQGRQRRTASDWPQREGQLAVAQGTEEVFGWVKGAAGFRKTRHRGFARVGWMLNLTAAAYNLVRLPKLVETAA